MPASQGLLGLEQIRTFVSSPLDLLFYDHDHHPTPSSSSSLFDTIIILHSPVSMPTQIRVVREQKKA